jgi:hypothetical protein
MNSKFITLIYRNNHKAKKESDGMAKAPSTHNDPQKNIDHSQEIISETEDYFQNSTPIKSSSKNSSTNQSFELLNTNKADDGVTIGILPIEKEGYQEEFDDILLETIDETLSSLGEPVKNAIYFHLQNNFNISKNEIPKKIIEFSDFIQKIFCSGASRLEIKFMKTLHSKINVDVKWPEYEGPLSKWVIMDMTFIEYVNNMRTTYEANAKKTLFIEQKTVEVI